MTNIGPSLKVPVGNAISVLEDCDRDGELADHEYDSTGAADEAFDNWERLTAEALDLLFGDAVLTNDFRTGVNIPAVSRRSSAMFLDRRGKLAELQAELFLLDLHEHRTDRLALARKMQSEDAVLLIEPNRADHLLTRQIRKGDSLVANAPSPLAMSDMAYRTVADEETNFRSYNLQLLRTLFDRNSVADAFDKRTTPFEFHVAGRRIDWANCRQIDVDDGTDPKEIVIERIRRQARELTRLRGTLSTIPRVASNLLGNTKVELPQVSITPPEVLMSPTKVFVVHGHAPGLTSEVARLIEHLGLKPVILAERPNSGATLIEKLLANADVSFAIVLATADDVGASKKATTTQARARQNVVFELGFFVGRLGRDRVALLIEPSVEIFSDFHGVVHHEIDQNGAWRLGLARELKAADLDVDLNDLA